MSQAEQVEGDEEGDGEVGPQGRFLLPSYRIWKLYRGRWLVL